MRCRTPAYAGRVSTSCILGRGSKVYLQVHSRTSTQFAVLCRWAASISRNAESRNAGSLPRNADGAVAV